MALLSWYFSQLLKPERASHYFTSQLWPQSRAYLIVMVIGNKAVLSINQNPAELGRRPRRTVNNRLSNGSARKPIQKITI